MLALRRHLLIFYSLQVCRVCEYKYECHEVEYIRLSDTLHTPMLALRQHSLRSFMRRR